MCILVFNKTFLFKNVRSKLVNKVFELCVKYVICLRLLQIKIGLSSLTYLLIFSKIENIYCNRRLVKKLVSMNN